MTREAQPHHSESRENKAAVRLERLKNLILTNEEYVRHPFAQDPEARTYCFEITQGEKSISYIGANHTKDPLDPLFDQIEQKFKQFDPDMVYVEGRAGIEKRRDELKQSTKGAETYQFRKLGEPTFTIKLALESDADFESPEPAFSEEITHLESKSFTRQEIFNFYIYRQIWQYQREHAHPDQESCKKYLEKYINEFFSSSGWDQCEITLYKEELLSDLDLSDHRKYYDQVDPIPWEGRPQNVYNEISRQSGRFRDEYALERIAVGLHTHDRVFVVFGSAHAVRLEPALRELMTQFDTLG